MNKLTIVTAISSLLAAGTVLAGVTSNSDSAANSGSESQAIAVTGASTSGSASDSRSGSVATGGNSDQRQQAVAVGGNSKQGQKQGQGQGQDQGQGQGQGQSINYAPYSYIEGTDLSESVPSFVLPGLTAGSNPCALSVSAGGSGAGFGFGVGWVYNDSECTVRENMRIVGGMLRANNNPNGQLVMKNLMCQSSQMWSSLELASLEGGGGKLRCINQQPGIGSYIKLRSHGEVASPKSVVRTPFSGSSARTDVGGFGY